jgi:hypothetical protein
MGLRRYAANDISAKWSIDDSSVLQFFFCIFGM